MNDATHEQLLKVVYAEWSVACLLTVAAIICFFKNRRTSFGFFPWLGVAYVAALHGLFFYKDGSATREMLVGFGIGFGLVFGAPIGAIFMRVLRYNNDRQTGIIPALRPARPNWPQTKFVWITAALGVVLLPMALALILGIRLQIGLDLVFWSVVGGVIGGRFGNWCRARA